MHIKISRKKCLHEYPVFPTRKYDYVKDEDVLFYPKSCSTQVLTLVSKTFKGHVTALAKELSRLVDYLGMENLIFLGDTTMPWLRQINDYKPVKKAQQYLRDSEIGDRFNGGLIVEKKALPVFIKHLCWLTRCNSALPYIHFTDQGMNFIVNICQYGNLHISSLNEQMSQRIEATLSETSFQVLRNGGCFNQFSKTGAIRGRSAQV